MKKLLFTVWMLFCSQLCYTPLYAEQYAEENAESFAITDEPSKLKFPGKFVWADLLTTDLTAASEFYQSVFGWQASTLSDDYILLSNNGRRLAGIVRNKFQLEEDERNQWISFVSTVDIDKAHKKLVDAGAEVSVEPVAVDGHLSNSHWWTVSVTAISRSSLMRSR